MKIAICGTAPSSAGLAPYDDPSWTIWGCSPGLMGAKRIDTWFEMHPAWMYADDSTYCQFLRSLDCPVWLIEPQPEIPQGVLFPKDRVVDEFGPWFFTSTVAWMMAYAILQKPEEVGLWGVDMSATEEYGYQRAGCHFFIQEARKRGIRVTAPFQSDLMQPPLLYGYSFASPMWRKLNARRQELLARKADAEQRQAQAHSDHLFISGALSDLEYQINTWIEAPELERSSVIPIRAA